MGSYKICLFVLVLFFLFVLPEKPSTAAELYRVTEGHVTFAWNPSPGAEGYILVFAPYPHAEYVGKVDIGNRTQVTFDIWEGASYYVGVQAYNSAGKSGISNIVAFLASGEEFPHAVTLDITANGTDGVLQVSSGIPVSICVNLALENYWGQNPDCWIAASTAHGWFSYVYPMGWVPGIQRYSGSGLSRLNSIEILNTPLPPGEYVFYLALDNNADGLPDATWWDSVTVKVE